MRFAVFLALGVFAFISSAAADCVSDCQASTYCGDSSWDCSRELSLCYSGCSGSGASSSSASGSFGAVAYDEYSGAYGLSDRSADRADAHASALSFCRKNGKNCEIVETFESTCAAIAGDGMGRVAGWSRNSDLQIASARAIEKCNRKALKPDCRVTVTNCYGP